MKIIWTGHAEERQKEWERKPGVTKQEVENLVGNPEQVVPGDMDVLIVQSRSRDGLLRAAFVKKGDE